ncbi:hypothetical protein H7U19_02480 [Hyunsoonleella sp. SJ7]|uniref:Uncharacterized protein n=1 Tax=Hyunsoonleella aquatilis TaxID=2762758 RepID=A0A923KHS4_9FLAO|nr:hypothetical protein [Hyunsoonleella aquatilis]MBC3757254.1 hypothetical protein [Hyunsoonleella aquatilis]
MKTLELSKMENIEGGRLFCAASMVGLAVSVVGAAAIVTTGGAALFLVGFVAGSISAAGSC